MGAQDLDRCQLENVARYVAEDGGIGEQAEVFGELDHHRLRYDVDRMSDLTLRGG